MCIFNEDVIHSGGFRSEVSTGNFRVQLIFTPKCFIANLNPWQDIFCRDFQYVTQDQINKYKFQKDTCFRRVDRKKFSFPRDNRIDNDEIIYQTQQRKMLVFQGAIVLIMTKIITKLNKKVVTKFSI